MSRLSPGDLGLGDAGPRLGAHLTSHAPWNALKRRRFIERKPVQISRGNETSHLREPLHHAGGAREWLMRHGKRGHNAPFDCSQPADT